MLSQYIRTIYSDNGALNDYSLELQNNEAVPFGVISTQDYLYIGQNYPFNNIYVNVETANAAASVLSVQYWGSKQWQNAVDVLDGTKLAGASMAKSGVVQWSPDRDESWDLVVDPSDPNEPAELATTNIYDMYWIRLKFSADLDVGTEIKKVGYCFATHDSLTAIDPSINEYLTAWGGNTKLDWLDQIQLASQHLVADLKSRQLVFNQGQIIRFDDISLACSYRTLALIYSGLGDPFKSKKDSALSEYTQLMSIKRFTLDANMNGKVDKNELGMSVGRLIR